jgi:hypothetical protein
MFETIRSSHTHIKHTLHSHPGVKYAQITKQNTCAPTNIQQQTHTMSANQQYTGLKKSVGKPVWANGNHAKPSSHQSLLNLNNGEIRETRLVECQPPNTAYGITENIYLYSQQWCHVNLRETLHWKKLSKTSQLYRLCEPSNQNCSR